MCEFKKRELSLKRWRGKSIQPSSPLSSTSSSSSTKTLSSENVKFSFFSLLLKLRQRLSISVKLSELDESPAAASQQKSFFNETNFAKKFQVNEPSS